MKKVVIEENIYEVREEFSSFDFKNNFTSSNISLVGYSFITSTFLITFNSGKTYVYNNVGIGVWADLCTNLTSEGFSIGKWSNSTIVRAGYDYREVEFKIIPQQGTLVYMLDLGGSEYTGKVDKELFISEAKQSGEVLTLSEFEERFNTPNGIDVNYHIVIK